MSNFYNSYALWAAAITEPEQNRPLAQMAMETAIERSEDKRYDDPPPHYLLFDNFHLWFTWAKRWAAATAVLLLCLPASADTIRFTASGYGIDETRINRITGTLGFSPSTDQIFNISNLSFQGVRPTDSGQVDPSLPFSGTFDGRTLSVTAFAGLLRQHDPGDCGPLATLSVDGDVLSGDMYFSLLYPDTVPEGCTLGSHFAEGRTTSSIATITVPEPSGWLLMILGMMGIWRNRKCQRVA